MKLDKDLIQKNEDEFLLFSMMNGFCEVIIIKD